MADVRIRRALQLHLAAFLALLVVPGAGCSEKKKDTGGTAGGGGGSLGGGGAGGTGTGGASAGATGGASAGNGGVGTGGASGGGGGGASGATGGATAGTGGASGAGGSTAIVLQPRALIIDPPTNRFQTFDLDGQPVRIFNSELEFGAGFGGQVIWVDGLGTGWDGSVLTGIFSPGGRGLEEPPAPSVILIRAAGSGMVKVKALEPSGTAVTTQTLSGVWNAFEMSPRRGYLGAHAQLAANNATTSAVVRVSDGQIVWQGSAWLAGFSRDDKHFAYFVSSQPYRLPYVVDLATGAEIASTSTQITSPGITSFQLLAVLNQRAVISASWLSYGMLLWTVDWQGRIAPFGSDVPMNVYETLQAFHPSGTKAVWSRTGGVTDAGAPPGLGSFEIDLATGTSTAWSGPDPSCFGRPGQVAFKLVGNAVQSCACGDGTCRDIATLPATSDARWLPRLRVSANRQTVVVTYEWMSAQAPTDPPEILCLRGSGEVITRVPWGLAELDDTGQMLLVRGFAGPMLSQIGIVNLVTGTATWIDRAQRATIVYE